MDGGPLKRNDLMMMIFYPENEITINIYNFNA